ncbi:hypothetical protein VCHA53O466_50138 [Vibrio chagasii]|nr:hypothetical protein VCHA53O466_50138 [Vibrio chagasii]
MQQMQGLNVKIENGEIIISVSEFAAIVRNTYAEGYIDRSIEMEKDVTLEELMAPATESWESSKAKNQTLCVDGDHNVSS